MLGKVVVRRVFRGLMYLSQAWQAHLAVLLKERYQLFTFSYLKGM